MYYKEIDIESDLCCKECELECFCPYSCFFKRENEETEG